MALRTATVLTSPVRRVCLIVGSFIRSQPVIAFDVCSELTHATCETRPKVCTSTKRAVHRANEVCLPPMLRARNLTPALFSLKTVSIVSWASMSFRGRWLHVIQERSIGSRGQHLFACSSRQWHFWHRRQSASPPPEARRRRSPLQ